MRQSGRALASWGRAGLGEDHTHGLQRCCCGLRRLFVVSVAGKVAGAFDAFSLLPWTRRSHAKQEKNTASWARFRYGWTWGRTQRGHPSSSCWIPNLRVVFYREVQRQDRTVEEVCLQSHVHSPGNASAGRGVAQETRYLIILSVGSPGEPCYDARATASSPRILLPGVGAWAAFFIRQITFQPSAPGPTPLARNPPNQSVNQQVHSCPSRPATKRQRPRQLPPSSSIHHHSSTNDPTHVSRAPSTTSVNFQTTLKTQPKTPSKCLPSPPTRSPPPRLPLPPRPPRRRMPLARRLPRLARRRSAPRRGRRPTPPTSTRVSSFSSTIWTRIQSRHSTFSVR